MPRASSTFAFEAQSGQKTQCVRLETGVGRLVYLARERGELGVEGRGQLGCVIGVVGHEPTTGCSAISNPHATYAAAWAS